MAFYSTQNKHVINLFEVNSKDISMKLTFFWNGVLLFVQVWIFSKIGVRGSENNSSENLATFNLPHPRSITWPRKKVKFERRIKSEYWEEIG